MKSELISIIMNCHNGEKFLKKALNSILQQTYENWELIFWDNNSNDKSKNIFKKFKDLGLNIFMQKNFLIFIVLVILQLKKPKENLSLF